MAPTYRNSHDYYMDHPNRGKCVVFNHEHFSYLHPRRGTKFDVDRIEKTFGRLGFSVQVYDDLDHDAILEKINAVSRENHSQNDCLCIIVLTHGEDNSKVCSSDISYKIKDLWKPFTANRCTTLAGKPKLFFFSACRGEERDSGVVLYDSVDETETDGLPSYVIPSEADFLFGFSSPPGYVSHREISEGTWYIQSLCDVLDKYGTKDHLLEILTKTTKKVCKRSAKYDEEGPQGKQVPEFHSRLSRRVYFKPKRGKGKIGPIFSRLVTLFTNGIRSVIRSLLRFRH